MRQATTHLHHHPQRLRRQLALPVSARVADEGEEDAVVHAHFPTPLLLRLRGRDAVGIAVVITPAGPDKTQAQDADDKRQTPTLPAPAACSALSRLSSPIASSSNPTAPSTSTTWRNPSHQPRNEGEKNRE